MKRLFLSIGLGLGAACLSIVLFWASLSGAAAGPILFSDDFEDGNADGWTVQAGGANWAVVTDEGNQVYRYTFPGSPSTARSIITETLIPGSTTWTDYIVQARVKVISGTGNFYPFLMARYKDARNYYFLTLRGDNGNVEVRRYYNGSSSGGTLGSAPGIVTNGVWYTATLELQGNTLRAYINDTLVVTAVDTDTVKAFTSGTVGLGTATASAMFDDVLVRSLVAPPSTYALTVLKAGAGSGTVTSEPAGIDCGTTCSAQFDAGAVVTLTATADAGSIFTGWSGTGCSGDGACVVTMDATKTVTATFELLVPTLSVSLAGNGNGSVTSDPAGIDCGTTCSVSFTYGAVVTLTATPAANSVFAGWEGACTGTGECVVVMDSSKAVTATFTLSSQPLTVLKAGSGSGMVTSTPAGIECGNTCTASFDYGTIVTLTATPDRSATFIGWNGSGCSGNGVCVVTMDAARTVTAVFAFNFTLPFSDDFESGAGKWTVEAGDWSVIVDGSQVYSQSNTSGAAIAISGSPTWSDYFVEARVKPTGGTYAMLIGRYHDQGNYYFMALRTNNGKIEFKKMLPSGSVGLGSVNAGIQAGTWYTAGLEIVGTTMRGYLNGRLMITVTDNTTTPPLLTGWMGLGTRDSGGEFDDVRVTSLVPVYPLTVATTGNGSGTVTSDPAGIDCGPTCTAGFDRGTVVTLTATPAPDSSFVGWTGACTGTGSCVVTMNAAQSVTAIFSSLTQPMLIVSKEGNGSGTVTSDPAGIDCGPTCTASFAQGTVVTLTAVADTFSTFAGWDGGGCSGTDVCVVTMDTAKWVRATFTFNTYPLAVTRAGSGSGRVTSTPAGIDCGVTCTAQMGGIVTLTAIADAGSSFTGWQGDCSGNGVCVLTMTSAKNVTAVFSHYVLYLPLTMAYIPPVTVPPLYVAPDGNDANPGTLTQPLRSLNRAVALAVAGQTIYLRGGVYAETETVFLTKYGNSVNYYKIWAYPDELPVLDFAGQPYTTTARGFQISGSYWHLQGLEIKNAGDNGIFIDGRHNLIERVILHDNRDSGLQISNGGAYNRVINSDSYRNFDPPDGSDADGFAAKLKAGPGNFFQGCRAWENADDGWDLFDNDYPVVIENSWTWHNGDRALFGNPVSWGGNGNGFKVGGNGNYAANILKNCIAFDHVYGTGSATKGFDLNNNRSGITVYNSLAFSNTINYAFATQPGDGTHHLLRNNIGFAAVSANANLSPDTIHDHNSWDLPGITANIADFRSLDVNLAKAPRQADGSLPDNDFARLVTDSDLIDQGVDVGIPYLGVAPDLGPFECR